MNYHHHCIMKKINFWFVSIIRKKIWVGDSQVMWVSLKATVGKLWRVPYDIECCRCRRLRFWLCILFSLDLERISFFIVHPSPNQMNFGLSLFFTMKVTFITFNSIFCNKFHQHFTLHEAYVQRHIFFILKKISAQQHLVSALLSC